MGKPGERKHSKFSASGAERWFNCPGSVELSEGRPDKSSVYAEEGTHAHEVLEYFMRKALGGPANSKAYDRAPNDMKDYAEDAARFILKKSREHSGALTMVESRVHLKFIHPDMFGTFDGAVVDHFDTLHVFDFKYGMTPVDPKENLQMIFYALGLAHAHQWNFKKAVLWIIQPRIKGYDGPSFWEISILELRSYVGEFVAAVRRVQERPDEYVEGPHCHWCKAKTVCPLKEKTKFEQAKRIFLNPG